jgi:hypothetical protein
MKNLKSNEASTEVKCSACGGTGFPTVAQPAQAGRKIYPPACKQCYKVGLGREPINPVVGGRPLWCEFRTQVGHCSTSEMCQLRTHTAQPFVALFDNFVGTQ